MNFLFTFETQVFNVKPFAKRIWHVLRQWSFLWFCVPFSLFSHPFSPLFLFSLQCSQVCLHPWDTRRLFKRHFHILILLRAIQILTYCWRSRDCKTVFISETDIHWWDSGVTDQNNYQAVDKEENKIWKVKDAYYQAARTWESFLIDFSDREVLIDSFSFSFVIFVHYVSPVLTKWKWDFAFPRLHRRAGDLGSFQFSCLDLNAQVLCPTSQPE